jgi:hypothetical protein
MYIWLVNNIVVLLIIIASNCYLQLTCAIKNSLEFDHLYLYEYYFK